MEYIIKEPSMAATQSKSIYSVPNRQCTLAKYLQNGREILTLMMSVIILDLSRHLWDQPRYTISFLHWPIPRLAPRLGDAKGAVVV